MIGVFGANGFIGQHVTRRLAGAGHEVVAVSRGFDTVEIPGVRRVTADLLDRDAMARALQGVDTVIHLMSSSTPAMGNAQIVGDIEHQVIPHATFVRQCIDAGVGRFVFMSSGGTVYGPHVGPDPVPETASTNPISAHGLTKLMLEKLIGLHGAVDGLDHVILRVANPFGPGQIVKHGQGLIPALLSRYESGLPIVILGDGSATRDFIYVEDVVDAVEAVVGLEGHQQLTLNIGTGQARSISDVVEALEKVGGITFRKQYAGERRTDVHSIRLDIERANEVLGWWPRTSFWRGIELTLEAHPVLPRVPQPGRPLS